MSVSKSFGKMETEVEKVRVRAAGEEGLRCGGEVHLYYTSQCAYLHLSPISSLDLLLSMRPFHNTRTRFNQVP